MNRTLVVLTAVLTLYGTAAQTVVLTTNTTIGAGVPTFDGQSIVVSNCTLTVNGAHSFAALLLASNAVLTHAAAPNGEVDNRIELAIAGDATVDATSVISATGRGYARGQGPGAGGQSSWGGEAGSGSVSVTATNQVITPASRTLDHVTTPQFGIDFSAEAVQRPALSVLKTGGNLRLAWDSQSGPTYQVYSTTNFIGWSLYGPLRSGTGGILIQECPMTNSPSQFFRVQTGN
jgi:hypothetical protein